MQYQLVNFSLKLEIKKFYHLELQYYQKYDLFHYQAYYFHFSMILFFI
jgi:hypothetical protein